MATIQLPTPGIEVTHSGGSSTSADSSYYWGKESHYADPTYYISILITHSVIKLWMDGGLWPELSWISTMGSR